MVPMLWRGRPGAWAVGDYVPNCALQAKLPDLIKPAPHVAIRLMLRLRDDLRIRSLHAL